MLLPMLTSLIRYEVCPFAQLFDNGAKKVIDIKRVLNVEIEVPVRFDVPPIYITKLKKIFNNP